MTRFFQIILTAGLLSATVQAASQADFLQGSVPRKTGDPMPYRLFVPADYDPQKPHPLMLFLHGWGERGTNNTSQINGNIDNLLKYCKKPEYSSFLLAPQSGDGGWRPEELEIAANAVRQVMDQYNINQEKVFVTGLSNGGNGAWHILALERDLFTAGIPICAASSTYFAPLLVEQNIWTFHAADDASLDVGYTRNMVAILRALGGNPIYTEYATGGHGIWGRVYNTEDIYVWMFSKKRPAPGPYMLPAPELRYSRSELGGGLTAYTFYLETKAKDPASYTIELAFRGINGAQIIQQDAFGAVAINSEAMANQFQNMGVPPYQKALDSWAYEPFGSNPSPGINPFTGESLNGFSWNGDIYAIALNSATPLGTDVDVIYLVTAGDVEWKGRIFHGAVQAEVSGTTQTGDYNGDHVVNQADYCVWADNYGWTGSPGTNPADGNNDGKVDMADYTLWADSFGNGR
jgi:predicted esterase